MPEINAILSSYSLLPGSFLNNCKILKSSGTHNVILRNRSYSYNITLIVDCQELSQTVNFQDKVINSAYGNPYLCHLDSVKSGPLKNNTIHIHGSSQRQF